jgi:hypothetical protein
MTDGFFNEEVLESFPVVDFLARRPFAWWDLAEVLRPDAFERLRADFPPLSLFEWHEDKARAYGQRPHKRYYLSYASDLYPSYEAPHGSVGLPKSAFPTTWQDFFTELETSPAYGRFIKACLGHSNFIVRYTFHVGVNGSEVSPHVDKGRKVGTHIFYFNDRDDWDPAWGGATLVLAGKQGERLDPGFGDFASATPVENLGNRSFLFKNSDAAWHGVRPLTAPEGAHRRLFNVIFEDVGTPPQAKASALRRIKRRAKALVREVTAGRGIG